MPLITFNDKVDSKVSTAPLINKIVADDINQLKTGVNANETAIAAISALPYTYLVQLLTQTGTNAPVATEVYNNTGETYTWSYVSSGVYNITSTSIPFTANKTLVFFNNGYQSSDILWRRISRNLIQINTIFNDKLIEGAFKIELYN
tara:strand:- start:528 stop:968 length:441 start_codon:yes stop_codon:yes gene_type:complete